MRYKIKKSLLGKETVYFPCPRCNAELNSNLESAGQPDTCPECEAPFRVPGTRELSERKQKETPAHGVAAAALNKEDEAKTTPVNEPELSQQAREQQADIERMQAREEEFVREQEAAFEAAEEQARRPVTAGDIDRVMREIKVLNARLESLTTRVPDFERDSSKFKMSSEVSKGVLQALAKWTLLPLAMLPGAVVIAFAFGRDNASEAWVGLALICVGGLFVLGKVLTWARVL